MHQKTADLYLLGCRGAAVPLQVQDPGSASVQVPEKGEAMPHPTGWTSLCARTAQPGPTGSVSPEQPATAVRRLSTSGCWKGMVGLFCVFDRFSSSSLSLLCPRVTPDPLSFLQSQGRWDGACSSLLPVPRCAVQMGLQGGMGSGC